MNSAAPTREHARSWLAAALNGQAAAGRLAGDELARLDALARLSGFADLAHARRLASADDDQVRVDALSRVRGAYYPPEHLARHGRPPEPPALAIRREVGVDDRYVFAGDHGHRALGTLSDPGRVHDAVSSATGIVARRIGVRDGYDDVRQSIVDAAVDIQLGTHAAVTLDAWLAAYLDDNPPIPVDDGDAPLLENHPQLDADGTVLVSATGFRLWLRVVEDERLSTEELARMAVEAGWGERVQIKVAGPYGRRTTRRCWRLRA
jgi:hypothetical protein